MKPFKNEKEAVQWVRENTNFGVCGVLIGKYQCVAGYVGYQMGPCEPFKPIRIRVGYVDIWHGPADMKENFHPVEVVTHAI